MGWKFASQAVAIILGACGLVLVVMVAKQTVQAEGSLYGE